MTTKELAKPTVVRSMPMEDYHAHDSVSSSSLADFAEDPLLWHYRRTGLLPRKSTTSAMAFGTQVHEALEKGVDAVCVTVPHYALNKDGHRRGKAYTEWLSEQPEGATILKEGEPNPFEFIKLHIDACPSMRPFLETPEAELSIFFQAFGVDARCRIDAISKHGVIGDWKTTRTITEYGFRREMAKMKYPLRLALYQLGVEAYTGEVLPVVCNAIENKPPYFVRSFEIDPEWLAYERGQIAKLLPAMESFDVCKYLDQPIVTLTQAYESQSLVLETEENE